MKAMQNADGKAVGSFAVGEWSVAETGRSGWKSGRHIAGEGRNRAKGGRDCADAGWNVEGGGRWSRAVASDVGNGGEGVLAGVLDVREGGRSVSEGFQSIPNRSRNEPDGVFHTAKLMRSVRCISFSVGNGVGDGRFGGDGTGFLKTQRRRGAEIAEVPKCVSPNGFGFPSCRFASAAFASLRLCVLGLVPMLQLGNACGSEALLRKEGMSGSPGHRVPLFPSAISAGGIGAAGRHPARAKQSFARKCVPKRSLGTRERGDGWKEGLRPLFFRESQMQKP